MLSPALTEESIPIHFWSFSTSCALIDPVVYCISQTHAIASLTQRVANHILDRMRYNLQEILPTDKTTIDRFRGCERLCVSNCTESCVFIVLWSRSDPAHSVYREICSDCHLPDSESQVCRF